MFGADILSNLIGNDLAIVVLFIIILIIVTVFVWLIASGKFKDIIDAWRKKEFYHLEIEDKQNDNLIGIKLGIDTLIEKFNDLPNCNACKTKQILEKKIIIYINDLEYKLSKRELILNVRDAVERKDFNGALKWSIDIFFDDFLKKAIKTFYSMQLTKIIIDKYIAVMEENKELICKELLEVILKITDKSVLDKNYLSDLGKELDDYSISIIAILKDKVV